MGTNKKKLVVKKSPGIIVIYCIFFLILTAGCLSKKYDTITVFCGAAGKPPVEEAARIFEQRERIKVHINFGGSGTLLSLMKLSRNADLYIPGSPDYMIRAIREKLIDGETEKILAYLIPAIVVQKGNPRNIRAIEDLIRPGLKVGIGNPEAVCVGLYAYEIFEYTGIINELRKSGTITTYAESCEKVATIVALKSVDAVMGWDVFSKWHPESLETIYLKPDQIPRLAYIPVAITKFARNRNGAMKFLNFLISDDGKKLFKKWGYIAMESEVRKFAPSARIGGEYNLPQSYHPLVRK